MLTKMVDGVEVVMSAEEEAATRAEWAASDAETPTKVAAATRRAEFETAISGDSDLQFFKTITKAQFDTWWAANVTNAAQAIAVLKKLAWLQIRDLK